MGGMVQSYPDWTNHGAGPATNGMTPGAPAFSTAGGGGVPQSNFVAQQANQGNSGFTQQDYSGAIGQSLANQAQANAGQQQLIGSLQQQMNGTGGPNLGQTQLMNATGQNLQTTAGQIGSLQGINPALAQRLISQNQSAVQQGAAGQSAVERQQQQLAAQQQLGTALAQNFGANQGMLSGAQSGNAQNLANYQDTQALNQQMQAANLNAASGAYAQQAQAATATNPMQLLSTAVGGAMNGAGAGAAKYFLGGGGGSGGGGGGGSLGVPDTSGFGIPPLTFSKGGVVEGAPTPKGVDSVPAMLKPGELVIPEEIVKLGPHAITSFVHRTLALRARHAR